jgi:hypothetical protein
MKKKTLCCWCDRQATTKLGGYDPACNEHAREFQNSYPINPEDWQEYQEYLDSLDSENIDAWFDNLAMFHKEK